MRAAQRFMTLGSKIPYEYFLTSGAGESDAGSKGLPFETGSYDAALAAAGIEDANIVEYSSVIPTEAVDIGRERGIRTIAWGEKLEAIMARANGKKGQTITAGVMTATVFDTNRNYLGGFGVEYSGPGDKKVVEEKLLVSIRGLIERRGYGKLPEKTNLYEDNTTDRGYTVHPGSKFVWSTIDPITKDHGSALAAICFVSFKVPVLSDTGYFDQQQSTKLRRHAGGRRKSTPKGRRKRRYKGGKRSRKAGR